MRNQFELLYTSSDLHSRIKRLLEAPRSRERRVIIVAYLGEGAEAYLPDPAGLEIVCSLTPVATSAAALTSLMARGASVRWSDRLHMKVYWSSKRGCVICSANVSSNALGAGSLKESGVFFVPGKVNIERLLVYAAPRRLRPEDLRRLDRDSDRLIAKTGDTRERVVSSVANYSAWYASPYRKPWKLGWWQDDSIATAIGARTISRERYGVKHPHGVLNNEPNRVHTADWLLCYQSPEIIDLDWMYVDYSVRVPRSDKRAYEGRFPTQQIQVHGNRHYPNPPFLIDRKFRSAFRRAAQDFGTDKLEAIASLGPPPKLLAMIDKAYRQ